MRTIKSRLVSNCKNTIRPWIIFQNFVAIPRNTDFFRTQFLYKLCCIRSVGVTLKKICGILHGAAMQRAKCKNTTRKRGMQTIAGRDNES